MMLLTGIWQREWRRLQIDIVLGACCVSTREVGGILCFICDMNLLPVVITYKFIAPPYKAILLELLATL